MTILQEKIYLFIDSLKISLTSKNYYAALTISMILPDICSKLEFPHEKNTGKRYSRWFDEYLSIKYKSIVGPDKREHVFLSGNDFYALRCSFLHQGETEIVNQRAREVLDDFVFVEPINGLYIHNNQIDDKLQLQIDVFCKDILEGVIQWVSKHETNEAINGRAKNIILIQKNINF